MAFIRRSIFAASCILHLASSSSQTLSPTRDSSAAQSRSDTLFPATALLSPFSILSSQDSISLVDRKTIRWGDYGYLGDLFWQVPGAFVRELGSIGQPSQATFRGLGWHNIGVLLDGRPMNEPLAGVADLNFFPLEAIQRVEYQTGVRAFLYGLNSTGGALNLVTQDFYTNRPYSRIRYSEGGYSFLSTDGVFTQNISQRTNLTAGFQRQTLDGRFPNSDLDAWNIRVKLKYLLSDRANLILSEFYNANQRGLNGGVNLSKTPELDLFDDLRATLRNTDSYEKIRRHDLSATIGMRLLKDSTAVSTATVYYSNNLREYRDEENRPNPNGVFVQSDHRSAWYGLKLDQRFEGWGNQLNVGAELQNRKTIRSPNVNPRTENAFTLTGKLERFFTGTKAAIFGRYDRIRGDDFFSLGADATIDILPSLSAYLGYSTSRRTATIQELYWTGAGVTRAQQIEDERHHLVEAGLFALAGEVLEVRANYFHRRINNPIVARMVTRTGAPSETFPATSIENASDRTISGVDGQVKISIGRLSGSGTWTLLTQPRDRPEEKICPEFYASGEIAFRSELLEGHLDLKVGLRGKFYTTHSGEQYNPETMMYVENSSAPINQHGSADFFLVGKVGSAYIHLLIENITDERYMLTPFYPMQDRKIRFGVDWEFLD